MIRRIIFVLGIAPVILYAFFYWIFTGNDGDPILDSFERWCKRT